MIYRVVTDFLARFLLGIFFLCGSTTIQAQTALVLSSCPQGTMALNSYLQIYQDRAGQKQLYDVEQLSESMWTATQEKSSTLGVLGSTDWYRLLIDNKASMQCKLWLNLGTELIPDVQLYSKQVDGHWNQQYLSMAYPLTEWAHLQRMSSWPIMLKADSRTILFLRTSNQEGFIVKPQLLSQQALTKQLVTDTLLTGMQIGAAVLLVVFSLLVGYLFRLNIALVHVFLIIAYVFYVAIVQGYAFIYLWPEAPNWNVQARLIAETLIHVIVLGYVRILLQVKNQPAAISILMSAAQLGLIFLFFLRLYFPHASWLIYGGSLSVILTAYIVLVVLFAMYISVRYKFISQWSCFIIVLFYICIVLFSPDQYSWVSIPALLSVLLLGYSLVSQIVLVWQREQLILADLEQLKCAEHEDLEQRVEKRTQQLHNALRNQNLLLAQISHDLRSPLQHVIRDARLLQTATSNSAYYGQSIQRVAQQQLELIDELLEFSRGELKQLELLFSPGYLFGFLREIEETGVFLSERNNNIFKCSFSEDLPLLVNADFRRLRQVIVNLIANAAKFTRQGEIVFSVNLISHNKITGYADMQFVISDNGIGIPKAEHENLLQPFARGESAARYEGVGLGLYIVRQLLDSMGSELLIENVQPTGLHCSFVLHLELAAEQELDKVFIESYASSEEGLQRMILIVDDVAITREMLYELLAGYDYNPLTCSSVAEALVILREYPIDIIVSDQIMPGMDGWDLLRNVRREWPSLPILLYSARPPVRPHDLDCEIDFDACLLKPAATSDLLEQINQLLR